MPLRSAPTWCARHDFARYASTLFVPAIQRRALLAIYAFNVEISRVREQVSQPLPGEMRLQWWTDMLAGRGPWRRRGQSGRGRTAAGDPEFPPAGRAAVAADRGAPVRSLQRSDAVDGGAGRLCQRHLVGAVFARRADRGAAVGGDRSSRAPRRPRPGHGAGDRGAAARCRAAAAVRAAAIAAAARQRHGGSIFRQADAERRARRSTNWSARRESILRPHSICSRTCRRRCGRCSCRSRWSAAICSGYRARMPIPLCRRRRRGCGPCGRCGAHRGRGSLAGRNVVNAVMRAKRSNPSRPSQRETGLLSLAFAGDAH